MSVSLENALEMLIDRMRVCYPIRLPLIHCYSRVLAEDIMSQIPLPPFTRSPFDGYAIHRDDIRRASPDRPVFLKQVDFAPVRPWPQRMDGANTAVRIDEPFIDRGQMAITVPQQDNNDPYPEGEAYRPGDVVLAKGTFLQEGAMGLLAMLGRSKLKIYAKPKVGILTTGSGLFSGSTPHPGKMHDANSYMLDAKVRMAGGISISLGHVEEAVDAVIERLHVSPRLPVYIVTDGAAAGDSDFAAKLFEQLHVSVLFDKAAIPGVPVLAGDWQGALLIALSGNPAVCSVSFEVLIRPLLRRMAGFKQWEHTKVMVKLSGPFSKPGPQRRFVWARCFEQNGAILATVLPYQGNGMLRSIVEANALLDIPADSALLHEGQKVTAFWLPYWF